MLCHFHTFSRRSSSSTLPSLLPPLLLPPFCSLLLHRRFDTTISHISPSTPPTSTISQSLLSKFPFFFNKEQKSLPPSTITDLIFTVFQISPSIARSFLRRSSFKPEDVLALLQAAQGSKSIKSAMAASLWEIFKWCTCHNNDFRHLPEAFPAMAAILVRFHLFEETEVLLTVMQNSSVLSHMDETFSILITAYVTKFKSKNALQVFDKMTSIGLSPSGVCFHFLLNDLVEGKQTIDAFRVFSSMIEMGVTLDRAHASVFCKLVKLLSFDGMLQQCIYIVRKLVHFGYELDPRILNYIAMGYSTRHEFDLLLNFCTEMKFAPDVVCVNRLISYLCRNYSVADADVFMRKLQKVGFLPDAVTMGVLISWSCHGRNLKTAFGYLSEICSKSMKPDLYSYNSIICGLFEEGLWCHAMVILEEMEEMGVKPALSTFSVLLAGYCRARRFEEAKTLVNEMVKRGIIQSNSTDSPLSAAFSFLGIHPESVKIRRVNDKDGLFFGSEFYDELGNGLVLDTDHDVFDRTLSGILNASIVVDFDSLVIRECTQGEQNTAVSLVESMGHWGHELSSMAFSTLLKYLGGSCHKYRVVTSLLERNPALAHLLEEGDLNSVLQIYARMGCPYEGLLLSKKMIQRKIKIRDDSYTVLVLSFSKDSDPRGLDSCWECVLKGKWVPSLENCREVVRCFCKNKEFVKVLELLDTMIESLPHIVSDICFVFFEELCSTGNTALMAILSKDLTSRGFVLDALLIQEKVLKGLCIEKKFQEALSVMGTVTYKNIPLSLDISSLLCLGKVEAAAHKFCDMLRMRETPEMEVYNLILQACCKGQKLQRVAGLLCLVLKNRVTLSLSTYRMLVKMICLKGQISQLLGLKAIMLRQGNFDRIVIYNILLFYILNSGNEVIADVILDEMRERGIKPNEVTYNFLTYGYYHCKNGLLSQAYMDRMISEGHKPNPRSIRVVICSFLSVEPDISCIDQGKAMRLSRLLVCMGCTHSSMVQNAVFASLISQGNLDEAESYMCRLMEKGLVPKHVCYDLIIKKLCYHDRLGMALCLMDTMLMKGSIPNSSTYDFVIRGLCWAGRVDDSLLFHQEMIGRRLQPILCTWNVLVYACCHAGRISEAEQLLKCMVQMGDTPTEHIYNSMIDRYRMDGNMEKAKEALMEMQKLGLHPAFQTHWSLITTLSDSKHKKKDNENKREKQGILSRLIYGTNSPSSNSSSRRTGTCY